MKLLTSGHMAQIAGTIANDPGIPFIVSDAQPFPIDALPDSTREALHTAIFQAAFRQSLMLWGESREAVVERFITPKFLRELSFILYWIQNGQKTGSE